MATPSEPELPLTKQNIEEFVQALLDDLRYGGGRQDALSSWTTARAAEGKAVAANEFFSMLGDAIDAIFLRHSDAPSADLRS